jgi:nucleotide-binding universal stress UspA family protein
MLRKILVPIDFSDTTEKVTKQLKKIAPCGKEVILLHVIDIRMFSMPVYLESAELTEFTIEKEMVQSVKEKLGKIKEKLEKAGFAKVRVIVEEGIPFDTILDIAETKKVSSIFIGDQGHTAVERMLLGSTAEKVARKAKVPVILVK